MIEVFNTADMAVQVNAASGEIVKFPRNVNLLMGEEDISAVLIDRIKYVSELSGRSLHLRQHSNGCCTDGRGISR